VVDILNESVTDNPCDEDSKCNLKLWPKRRRRGMREGRQSDNLMESRDGSASFSCCNLRKKNWNHNRFQSNTEPCDESASEENIFVGDAAHDRPTNEGEVVEKHRSTATEFLDDLIWECCLSQMEGRYGEGGRERKRLTSDGALPSKQPIQAPTTMSDVAKEASTGRDERWERRRKK
jgi:hypothetical protein